MEEKGRILTTHVGSLPRPQDVVDQVFAEDRGEVIDRDEYERVIGAAVKDRVQHQVDAGVDIVSDGEMSKIGYATFIRHRLSGFEVGDVPRATPADLDAYPSFRDRLASEGATAKYLRPICRGPIAYENREPLERDLARLQEAIAGQPVVGAFMNAPSPGIVALFQPNEFYATTDEYLEAIANAMKVEYEGIVNAGFYLQIDAPDLAMGRHIMYRDEPDEVFVERAAVHVDAINHALRDVPPTACACTCAGATTRARTTSTSSCARSSTTSSASSRRRCSSRPPTRATPTSGPSGPRTATGSPTTASSSPASSTPLPTTSSTPS